MPLPPSDVKRKHVHTRTIACQGFERVDGAWEGGRLDHRHQDLWRRFTRTDSRTPGRAHARHGYAPYGCRQHADHRYRGRSGSFALPHLSHITPSFRKPIGLSLTKGFRKSVRDLLGGNKGCVHLVDILGPMATTLFKTTTKRRFKQLRDAEDRGEKLRPPVINTCHAWSSDGPVVKRDFPDFYTGKS